MSQDEYPLEKNLYFWSKELSQQPLSDYLAKHRPSMVQNDGNKPWIWVERCYPGKDDSGKEDALKEGREILEDVTKEVQRIQNDVSIPTRSNKKTGTKSKKELREQKQAEATEKLKEISIRHRYVNGKWLINASAEKIDSIWSSLANSLVDGPLSSTPAFLAKVSTSPAVETPNYQHVICLYMPDVYDKTTVTQVMRTLLRNHGFNLTGVKSDFYTMLGIDSKHPSGLQSTIWRSTALMKESEIKELKDAYFNELAAGKTATTSAPVDTSKVASPPKPKLKLKKKQNDDPFASDDDSDKVKKVKKDAKRSKESDTEDEEDERPKKKQILKKS